MPHIAFFLPPATHGHVFPTFPVIRELVAKGARVSYFSPPLPGVDAEVRAAGGEFRAYDPIFRFKERDDEPRSVSWAAYPRRVIADAMHVAERLEGTLRDLRPDVIVHDFSCVAGRILGHALARPTVVLYPTFPTNRHFPLTKIVPIDVPEDHPERVAFHRVVQEITARWGLPASTDDEMFVPSALLNVVFMPREFHPAGHTFGESYRFVGPSFGPRATPAATLPSRDRSRPLYYVSLGTAFSNQPDFFRLCLETLSALDGDLVMSIGKHFDRSLLGPVPDNVTLASFVSQLDVLPHCTAFVTHGGMNSVMESLFHGVPMVVVPQIPEQACTAKWVAASKLGVTMDPRERSPKVLLDAVNTAVRDPAIAESVRAMKQIVRASDGPRAAAEAILSLVASDAENVVVA